MQESLSLESGLFQVKEVTSYLGFRVPWEVNGYEQDYRLATVQGGVFDLSGFGMVRVQGRDTADYLNRMSTVAVPRQKQGEIVHGAFLTGKGLVVALGFFEKCDSETFHLVLSFGQAQRTVEHIEQFHFSEAFTVEDQSHQYAVFGIWDSQGRISKTLGLDETPLVVRSTSLSGLELSVWRDDLRKALLWTRVSREKGKDFLKGLSEQGLALLGHRLFEYFRIENAIPAVGAEIQGTEIILETGFERAVARNKGCYPGQEVVERIYTYGSVNRKLLPVSFPLPAGKSLQLPYPVTIGGKAAGQVVSYAIDPKDQTRAIGLAYFHKAFWDEAKEIEIT